MIQFNKVESDIMLCKRCHKQVASSVLICANCEKKMNKDIKPTILNMSDMPGIKYGHKKEIYKPREKEMMSLKGIFILLILLLIFIIIIILVYLV